MDKHCATGVYVRTYALGVDSRMVEARELQKRLHVALSSAKALTSSSSLAFIPGWECMRKEIESFLSLEYIS